MPAQKRSASSALAAAPRRSGRKSTAPKIKRAPVNNKDEDEDDDDFGTDPDASLGQAAASSEADEDEEEDETDDGHICKRAKQKKKQQPVGRPARAPARKRRVVRVKPDASAEDEDDEDEDEDDAPKVQILPLEQLRPTGGQEYADDKVHPNTLLFLADLRQNNNRAWLKSHDGEFRRSLQDWQSFVGSFTTKVIEVDDTIPELPAKDVVFRIYRDTRFSKDPTPYKTSYSAGWSRTGRKGPYACYYLHCEPGRSFLAGGLFAPDSAALARLRASINDGPRRWRRALAHNGLRREFLGDTSDTSCCHSVNAFVQHNQANALKSHPRDYSPHHADIHLLRLRSFTVSAELADTLFSSPDGQRRIADKVDALKAFVTFLNNIVKPDPGYEESEHSEDLDDTSG